MSVQRPMPRRNDLLARRVDAELIVHDTRSGRISHLDRLTTEVWDLLDGRLDISDLAERVGASESEIEDMLGHLAAADLLDDQGIDRRRLLARVGVASLVAPVVSIMAPSAAAAASPLEPEVGWSRVCGGSKTDSITLTLTGFVAGSQVTLISLPEPSSQTVTADINGVATFVWTYGRSGPPTPRTVTVQSYQVDGTTVSFIDSFTSDCRNQPIRP